MKKKSKQPKPTFNLPHKEGFARMLGTPGVKPPTEPSSDQTESDQAHQSTKDAPTKQRT